MAEEKQIRKKQPRQWAIRDDGMLYPAYDSVLKNPAYRPYHGDINASLEERLAYLRGEKANSQAKVDAEMGVFNIATAEKEDLIDFMLDEYGHQLDARKSIEKLRTEAVMFIQLKQAEEAGVAAPTAEAEPEAQAPKAKAPKKIPAGIAA